MLVLPYKHYLQHLERRSKPSHFKKAVLVFIALVLITGGITSSFLYWQYKTEEPLRVQTKYLQQAAAGFASTKQEISEISGSFQVAGTKIKVIDNLKEASAASVSASGVFNTSLEDIQKSSDLLQTLKQNIKTQEKLLKDQIVPEKFIPLQKDLFSFYNNTIDALNAALTQQSFAKQILTASGSNFFLPVLTDESLWTNPNKDKIKAYYQAKKAEADTTLASLSKLTVPEDFQSYYQNQVAYMTLLVDTSDKIISLVSKDDDKDLSQPTQIEKAYQLLNAAKKENDPISKQLLDQRLRVFDAKNNMERFAGVRLAQNSLQSKISDIYDRQPQPHELPKILVAIFQYRPKFLQALQVPGLI